MDNPVLESASSTPSASPDASETAPPDIDASHRVTVDQLLLAGAHFGHLTQRWNPKMKPYIFMARNGIYLIDLLKTQKALDSACEAIAQTAAVGEEILFVGTKKQARKVIEDEATRAECSYVTYRWLGGMLTNFATIRRSVKTLESYEKMETDGTYDKLTKKEQLYIEKAKMKLMRILGGIRHMRRIPSAVFIVDTMRESIAVAEARKLGIPIFAVVDTNSDPDLVDYPIPANDDAFKSVGVIANAVANAIIEGKRFYEDQQAKVAEEAVIKEGAEQVVKPRPRRSRRRRSRAPRSNAQTSTERNNKKGSDS